MGWEELKWCQLAHHQLMSQQGRILVHTVKLKPIIKAQISGKLVTSGISDVAFASVYSVKTRLKKMIMIIRPYQLDYMFLGLGLRKKGTR